MTRALILALLLCAAPAVAQVAAPNEHAVFRCHLPAWSDSAGTGLPWTGAPANVRGVAVYCLLDSGYMWRPVTVVSWKSDHDGLPFSFQVHGLAFRDSVRVRITTRDQARNWQPRDAFATYRRVQP